MKEQEMKEEILSILRKLLSFKTIKGETEEFSKLFNYVKTLESNLIIKEYDFEGKKGLVLSNTEDKELDLIFCTHVDVVVADNYEIVEDEETIKGRGTIDMKGSVAVCLALMKHINTKQKIGLFITTDEEVDGYVASRLANIYKAGLVIVPDGGRDFTLIKEEKGLLQIKVNVTGKRAHSSQPWNGNNAIDKLMDIYKMIILKYPLPTSEDEYITSVNIASIKGGIGNNLVPDYAEMVLDIRHIYKDKKEKIIKYIKSLDKNIEVEEILTGSVFKCDIKNKEIQRYIKVCEKVLDRKIEIKGCESTSDAIYFADLNMPTIIMNPEGYYAHGPNEYVKKDSLYKLYVIYKTFIEENNNE